jgi:hypothetical protein
MQAKPKSGNARSETPDCAVLHPGYKYFRAARRTATVLYFQGVCLKIKHWPWLQGRGYRAEAPNYKTLDPRD